MERSKVLQYLSAHPELHRAGVQSVVRGLKAVGLIAPRTKAEDCKSIPRLLREAQQIQPANLAKSRSAR
jgi:hypothetical protein